VAVPEGALAGRVGLKLDEAELPRNRGFSALSIAPITELMTAIILLLIVGTTVWVGVDASKRDWSNSGFAKSTTQWVIGSLLLWIIVFPVYLGKRGSAPLKAVQQ
jgi:hypothetical protein